MRRWNIDPNIPLLLALSLFAWAALVGPTYFLEAHDARHALFFLNNFDQALRDGALYPRWATDFALGYGYPVFIVYPPLAFYLAEAFHLLGASLTASVKIVYALAFVLSGFSMYLFARSILGRAGGLISALAYVYIPYHLVDIYVRSAFAEFLAFVFLPLVLWGFYRLMHTHEIRYLALSGLAYGALFLTHAGTAFIFTPLLGAYLFFGFLSQLDRRRWLCSLGLVVIGLLLALALAAAFLLPLFFERQYMVEEQWISGSYSYARHFVYPSQLFSPFWGYGYAGEGLKDEMSFQLGAVAVILALVGATLGLFGRTMGQDLGERKGYLAFFLVITLLLVLIMLPLAGPIWRLLPLAPLVQFPWRLLALVAFGLSFLAGGTGSLLESEEGRPVLLMLALIIVLGSYSYCTPQHTEARARAEQPVAVIDFETFHPPDRVGMTVWVEEQPQDSPLVAQYLAGKPLVVAHALTEGAQVEMVRHGGASEEIRVTSSGEAEVWFYKYYFPGWRAYVDGHEVPIYPSGPYALISLKVPEGDHKVTIRFEDTPVRMAGNLISLLGLVLAVGMLVKPALGKGRPS